MFLDILIDIFYEFGPRKICLVPVDDDFNEYNNNNDAENPCARK